MINQKSLSEIEKGSYKAHFCRPLYDSYSFSRIPATILSLLAPQKKPLKREMLPADCIYSQEVDSVILLFVDGFGWRFFEKYAKEFPFLTRFIERGIASKLTALFPSTTAAHVTCLNTNLLPAQSGIYEWFYYEPKVDRVIAPLIFSFAGDKRDSSLKEAGMTPEELFPFSTFYQTLQSHGVTSLVFQQTGLVHSPYSDAMFKGAEQIGWETFEEGLQKLCTAHAQIAGKSYFYIYFGDIDAQGHRHGIDSAQFELAVRHCFEALEKVLFKALSQSDKKTACLLIADHGMTAVHPKTTFYLNEKVPDIDRFFKRNQKGDAIVPAGSCRDFFLHVKEECLGGVQDLLQDLLKDQALVIQTETLIKEGFFGKQKPSERFLERVGNMVILPYENESVWWRVRHRFEQHFYGSHGGLSRHEMEIPFLFLEMGKRGQDGQDRFAAG